MRVLVEADLVHRLGDVAAVAPPVVVVRVAARLERAGVGRGDEAAVGADAVAQHEDAPPVHVAGLARDLGGQARVLVVDPVVPEVDGLALQLLGVAPLEVGPEGVHVLPAVADHAQQAHGGRPARGRVHVPLHDAVRGAVRDAAALQLAVLGVHVGALEALEGVLAAGEVAEAGAAHVLEVVVALVVVEGAALLVPVRRVLVHALRDHQALVVEDAVAARLRRLVVDGDAPDDEVVVAVHRVHDLHVGQGPRVDGAAGVRALVVVLRDVPVGVLAQPGEGLVGFIEEAQLDGAEVLVLPREGVVEVGPVALLVDGEEDPAVPGEEGDHARTSGESPGEPLKPFSKRRPGGFGVRSTTRPRTVSGPVGGGLFRCPPLGGRDVRACGRR